MNVLRSSVRHDRRRRRQHWSLKPIVGVRKCVSRKGYTS
jgi:hypothetical protein